MSNINTAIKDAGIQLGKRVVYTIDQENKTLTAAQKAELASYSNDYVLSTIKGRVVSTPPAPTILLQDSFTTPWNLKDGQISPNNLWRDIYGGYGYVKSELGYLEMAPQAVATKDQTSACLLLSEDNFKDFRITFDMCTLAHTRLYTPPNDWETAWFFFRYSDKYHHDYFYLGKDGLLEIGKKDYTPSGNNSIVTPDGVLHSGVGLDNQAFLYTKENAVKFELGKWYSIDLTVKGFNFKLSIDGIQIADITDNGKTGNMFNTPINYQPSPAMASGKIGFYAEDSKVRYRNVKVVQA